MKKTCIDLHSHSTASDGSMTPTELIRHAMTKDISAIAVTDHDCIDGLEVAIAEGKRHGIEVIPGLEISADFDHGTMHILGFFVDWQSESFGKQLDRLKEARRQRNPQIVEKLNEVGLNLTYEEVVAASGGGQVGRPHFAKVLVQKGYVASFEEAFQRYLKKGAPGYVEKFRFSPQKSIEIIHQAGGVAVLAHPFTLGFSPAALEEGAMKDLVQAGLDGIEVYYSKNSPKDTQFYLNLSKSLELLPSGGSDFHGTHKPDIDLGVGRGDLCVPSVLLDSIRDRARQWSRRYPSS